MPGIYRKLVHMGLLETVPRLMSKGSLGESNAHLQNCVAYVKIRKEVSQAFHEMKTSRHLKQTM